MLAVRIARIEICKLKNVAYGRVDLLNDRYRSNVLGLYGQNGSGKTTLINALSLLKTLMSGRRLKADTVNLIAQGQSAASLAFDFVLSDLDCYQQRYSVILQEEYTSLKSSKLEELPRFWVMNWQPSKLP